MPTFRQSLIGCSPARETMSVGRQWRECAYHAWTASCDAALSRNRNTLGRGIVRATLGARALEPYNDNPIHSLTGPAEADGHAQFPLSYCTVGLLKVQPPGYTMPETTS